MNIIVFGGGSFGTAIAHQLSFNIDNNVTILLRNEKTRDEINEMNTNSNYFLNRMLNKSVRATTDFSIIKEADLLLIAIPTKSMNGVLKDVKNYLRKQTLIVNTSKGLYQHGKTIVEFLRETLDHENIVSLKGASFSAEMIERSPTLLTLGYEKKEQFDLIEKITRSTNIYLDFTTDIRGVELLSAIKNIYAILIGNIDAKFNSANTRFLFLTKAFSEVRIILNLLGGREDTLFLSCGIGDICLTSLNDLSRNRTLGLLIGKGFYNALSEDNSVVLEGIKTLNLIDGIIDEQQRRRLPLLNKMISLFIDKKESTLNLDFDAVFRGNYKTVITYGTFDLFHFGHLEILRRAKKLGDRLIVGLSTDHFNEVKGKSCEIPFERRKQYLESLQYVDLVIPENSWEQKIEDIKNNNVDILVMGDDWAGKFDELNTYCKVIYIPRTKWISTTGIKELINQEKSRY
ncbi:MAG: NAD(P)H-dependent glycerol-3-phosphate dehydrogenase [Ginsengibacter sp.]